MWSSLWTDENGVVVSAEAVLILTLVVIGLIVGLGELQHAAVQELDDVGNGVGALQQSYEYPGFAGEKSGVTDLEKSRFNGSSFIDLEDECDGNVTIACDDPTPESPK